MSSEVFKFRIAKEEVRLGYSLNAQDIDAQIKIAVFFGIVISWIILPSLPLTGLARGIVASILESRRVDGTGAIRRSISWTTASRYGSEFRVSLDRVSR